MDALNDFVHAWLAPLGWTGEAVLRMLLAAVLGSLVGLERELRGREAGFRTNLLVCLGSAVVMLVSIRFVDHPWGTSQGITISVDPGRIAYGVMTGIGFLGAGAILKVGSTVRGLTTAAGLWCVAAIGLAAGFGLYTLACAAALMVLIALWLLDYLEDALPRRRFRLLTVRCPWQDDCIGNLVHRLEMTGVDVEDQSFRRQEDLTYVDVDLSVSYTSYKRYLSAEKALQDDAHCRLIASRRI
ncbi:MAG TPA: MgtC/SapB family protein [Tepidisphaeraceae bacterium]|nr:MgtC/SapB family protein [Tepidisphaeraceae bacterium]